MFLVGLFVIGWRTPEKLLAFVCISAILFVAYVSVLACFDLLVADILW